MRRATYALVLGWLLLLGGCVLPWMKPGPNNNVQTPRPGEAPTAAELVSQLNQNAQRVQTVDCRELDLDAKQRLQSVGLSGWMVCQKPRFFRMGANVAGNQMVDMGSNDREFWFWVSKAEPPGLYHCSYDDYAKGQARLPFPFQPEWIMEAMGIGEPRSPEHYQVFARGNNIELVEQTQSAQGKPVRKVTVFNRGNPPQVVGHILQDANGKEICSASIKQSQQDSKTGAILPRTLILSWPEEKMELKMTLGHLLINGQIEQQRFVRLFTRPTLANVPSIDLARGYDPGARPTSGSPSAVRGVSGWMR